MTHNCRHDFLSILIFENLSKLCTLVSESMWACGQGLERGHGRGHVGMWARALSVGEGLECGQGFECVRA